MINTLVSSIFLMVLNVISSHEKVVVVPDKYSLGDTIKKGDLIHIDGYWDNRDNRANISISSGDCLLNAKIIHHFGIREGEKLTISVEDGQITVFSDQLSSSYKDGSGAY